MALDERTQDLLHLELLEAEKTRTPLTAFTKRYPGIDISDSYAIQLKVVQTKLNRGLHVVGKKIGQVSRAMQELMGIMEPDYGHILNDMTVPEGEPIHVGSLLQPRVEGEICFVLKHDLNGPGVTLASVLEATAGVLPALEIIDSRFENWKVKIEDGVADNAAAGLVVLGGTLTDINNLDLRLIGMVLEKDGEILSTGAGAAVLGNPAEAVVWLANKLAEHGVGLRGGELIMSGSLTAAIPAEAGSCFRATFDRLGPVTARFV
jgi:2-oxopent-4-enoate hydratase